MRPKAKRLRQIGSVALGSALWLSMAFAGCKEYGVPSGTSPHYEFNFLDMGDQPKVKAQRGDLLGGPEFMPPQGAIPQGFDPYPYHNQPELAGQMLKNPLPEGDPQVLARGKLVFERYCTPCHDAKGSGHGTVVARGFPQPPSLMSNKIRTWADGRIYHVISEGQNIMPSYAAQVRQQDRWAVIRYVRSLQSTEPVAPDPPPTAAPTPSQAPTASASASASAPPVDSSAPPVNSVAIPATSTSARAPAIPRPSATAPKPHTSSSPAEVRP